MNQIISRRTKINEILKVNSDASFHSFFFRNSIKLYQNNIRLRDFGSILALGANEKEAEDLIKYPFKKIVLTGITKPNEKIKEIIKKDKRVSYKIENIEKLSFRSGSFDLVFVKEALHHVPRPILGLYEMLRVSKKAIIFIEPRESFFGNILNFFNLSSKYERNQKGNKKFRDNFVYRWDEKEVEKLLNSYYLDSGYRLIFSNCWMSNRYNQKFKSLIKIFNFFGWLMSFIPRNKGNYMICMVVPGKNLPEN